MANKEEKSTNLVPTMSIDDALSSMGDLFRTERGKINEGLEAMDQTDIRIPKIKIAQTQSDEVAKGKARPGQLYNSLTEKAYDYIDIALLNLGKRRTMWPAKFKRGDNAMCWSIDTIRGTTDDGVSRRCEGCQFADWSKIGKDDKHPPCMMGYSWLGMILKTPEQPEGGVPFRLLVSGKSVSITKSFLNILSLKGRALFVYNVRISTVLESNESGNYYVLKYDFVGGIKNEAEGIERREMKEGMLGLFQRAMAADVVAADTAFDDVNSGIDGGSGATNVTPGTNAF